MEGLIDSIINNAQKLGSLSATAIWAFFTIILLAFIFWKLKVDKESQELAFQMRIKDAESDIMMANAVTQLKDEVKEFRHTIRCIGGKDV